MKRSSSLMFLFTLLVLVLASCGPIPYLKMSSAERVADMHWVFSIYEQNYAPLKYKEQKFGFNFEDLKASYLVKAEAEQSNTEFFALMQSFVAEFKDAHNSGSFIPQNYKGYVQVAYLGFDGVRDGDGFYVERLLPTYTDPTGYPIYVCDIITKINGKSLKEAVDTEVSKYRNLGRNESN